LASYPPPTRKREAKPRGSWPLSTFPLGKPKIRTTRQPAPSPLRQQTLGRGIVSQRTMDTPSPPGRGGGGFCGFLFPKFDRNDRSPTGPLVFQNLADERKGRDGDPPRHRRCCGLRLRTWFILLLLLIIVAVVATVVPILVIRHHNTVSGTGNMTNPDCQCQNGGAVLINAPPQCTCLCPAGFTGPQCQTHDSACVPISLGTAGKNTSIGSAIAPLLSVAAANFSSQFTLSASAIIQQFALANVSCTSQNSLVNLDGSTNADFSAPEAPVAVQQQVVVFQAWTTTTSTTTLTLTFTTTLPFVTSSASSTWTAVTSRAATTTITSRTASSTFSLATTTVNVMPSATGTTVDGLVFGRCVILAVVQDLGVSSAADVQNLLETAVEHGETFVHDNATGLSIDLSRETVSGLPTSNGTSVGTSRK